jgi:molecular chaperone GrpE
MVKAKKPLHHALYQATEEQTVQASGMEEKELPPSSDNDMELLKKELEEARQKASENLECWQRERADFVNYRKRVEREQETLKQTITWAVIKKYLAIMDDMERALKARPSEGAAWAEGFDLIYRKLQGILDAEGITRIAAEKTMFDPNLHEALSHEDSPDHASGEVIEIIQQGYLLGDRVLRHALVRVAK